MLGLRANTGNSSQPYWTQQYRDVLAAMATSPSPSDQFYQRRWLYKMIKKGYYAKAELLDMFCLDTQANSLINLKSPGTFNPTLVSTPAFVPYQGFRGATNKCVKTNFIPSVNGTLISRNNITVLIAVGEDRVHGTADFGVDSNADGCWNLVTKTGTTNAVFKANDKTSSSISNADSVKYFGFSRNELAKYYANINKTVTTVNVASTGLPSLEPYVCGLNGNGTLYYGGKLVRFLFIFSYLTETERNDVIDITEEYLTAYRTNILNYDNYVAKSILATKAEVALTTYDGSGQTCHPSVISPLDGTAWNGYKYWMANTPLPASNSDYENPSIWASNDGVTWVVPVGGTNPIIAKPAGSHYNADSEIFYDSASDRIYLLWNENPDGICKICHTSDGVTWSAEQTLDWDAGTINAGGSPSWIKIGSKYYIYFDDFISGAPLTSRIKRVSCDTIDGTYGNLETITAPAELGYLWWHLDIIYLNGYYWLSACSSTNNVVGPFIYIMKSADGITFTRNTYGTISATDTHEVSGGLYRPSLVVIEGQTVVYYGRQYLAPASTWSTAKINVTLL